MSIISWVVLDLIAGFIGSKLVNKTGEGSSSTSPWVSWERWSGAGCSAWPAWAGWPD